MAGLVHKIRIRTSHWRQRPSLRHLQSIADQINERAQDKRLIGQIAGVGLNDGRSRIRQASHFVLPTARVRGSSIVVDVEIVTDNSPGRTVAALINSGVPIQGTLRCVMSDLDDIRVSGVDIDLSHAPPEDTVLDDIVDALEASDN